MASEESEASGLRSVAVCRDARLDWGANADLITCTQAVIGPLSFAMTVLVKTR
jgi:hypothetical protein